MKHHYFFVFLLWLTSCGHPKDSSEATTGDSCQNIDKILRPCTKDETWLQNTLNGLYNRLWPKVSPSDKISVKFPEVLISDQDATIEDLSEVQILLLGEQHNKPDWTIYNLILGSLALKKGQITHVLLEEPYASDLLPFFSCADAYVWQLIMEIRKQHNLPKYTKDQGEQLFQAIEPGLSNKRKQLQSFNLKCGTWDATELVTQKGINYARTVEGQKKRNQQMIKTFHNLLMQDPNSKIIAFGGAAHFPLSQLYYNFYRLLRLALHKKTELPGLESYLKGKLGDTFSVAQYYKFAKDWYHEKIYSEHPLLKDNFLDLNTSELVATGIKDFKTITITGARIGLDN